MRSMSWNLGWSRKDHQCQNFVLLVGPSPLPTSLPDTQPHRAVCLWTIRFTLICPWYLLESDTKRSLNIVLWVLIPTWLSVSGFWCQQPQELSEETLPLYPPGNQHQSSEKPRDPQSWTFLLASCSNRSWTLLGEHCFPRNPFKWLLFYHQTPCTRKPR